MSSRTERDNKRPFLDGTKRANLAFVVTFLLFATIAGRNYLTHIRKERDEQRANFTSEARNRQLRLVHLLESRRALLTSIVAYFGTSTQVNNDKFALYASQLGPLPLDALCWHSLDQSKNFAVGFGSSSATACEMFDPARPSQVYRNGSDAHIILSQYARTREPGQEGHVSMVMPVMSLALEDSPHEVIERLLVEDTTRHSAASFRLSDDVSFDDAPDAAPSPSMVFFDLAQFDDMKIRYAAQPGFHGAQRSTAELLFSASVVVVGLLAGAYLRNLLSTRTKISEQVRIKTAELSQFAYRTTHDLRGPLVTVAGLCRAVREDLEQGQSAEAVANVGRIEQRIQRLDTLVRDILDMTRADVGQFQAEPVDLEDLVVEVREHVLSTVGADQVRVEHSVSAEKHVNLPRTRLFQILNNLLSNSIKYSNPTRQPHVTVAVKAEPKRLELIVEDNGLGIPEQYQDRMFQMFERFHPSVKAVGSGLGMSIVKRHVDHLGGTIEVVSNDDGTKISVDIPLASD